MTLVPHDLTDRMRETGFALFPRQSGSIDRLFSLLRDTRHPGLRVSKLRPRLEFDAKPNSLSSRYGAGRFPPHTDFAREDVPPRYVALVCTVKRPALTLLYDPATGIEASDLGDSLFRVDAGRKKFSCHFASKRSGAHFVRYNIDLMTPQNDAARRVADAVSNALTPVAEVSWEKNSVVIFDNWRLLHGRASAEYDVSGWLWRFAWGFN